MIRIDAREKDLISLIRTKYPEDKIIVESLALGDCIIEKNENEIVIIERKTVSDLLASVKDGRYKEQSFRLNGHPIHNHNVVYLIEGDINRLRLPVDKKIAHSSIFSIQYFKGFSVMRTFNLEETATYICNSASKMVQKDEKGFYVNSAIEVSLQQRETPSYSTVVKQVKKENITPENIGEIMLCQIPGVSPTCAVAVMQKFKYFQNLIADLQEHGESCLKDVSWTNSKGQVKKINNPCCANIVKYLI
jgi:crossover junction endonuclease MUS81